VQSPVEPIDCLACAADVRRVHGLAPWARRFLFGSAETAIRPAVSVAEE
jgi:hypothetical protein